MKTLWIPGAVSATFKKTPLSADEIIDLMTDCGLKAVEWSENLHVQPDDPEGAALLRKKTEAAGLKVAAYGSYFRLGENKDPGQAFERSLRSAKALGAPLIRVWAGIQASADVSDEQFRRLSDEASLIAEEAGREQIKVAFEWHKNTLTDTNQSARRLLAQANHPNLYCLWQPTVALTPRACRVDGIDFLGAEGGDVYRLRIDCGKGGYIRERVQGIAMMSSRLLNFHVYSWPDGKRGPLNAAEWQYYLDAAADMGGTHCALLEFVLGDTAEQFRADAKTLLNLLESGE